LFGGLLQPVGAHGKHPIHFDSSSEEPEKLSWNTRRDPAGAIAGRGRFWTGSEVLSCDGAGLDRAGTGPVWPRSSLYLAGVKLSAAGDEWTIDMKPASRAPQAKAATHHEAKPRQDHALLTA
jgi:hypothetical protein